MGLTHCYKTTVFFTFIHYTWPNIFKATTVKFGVKVLTWDTLTRV